MSSFTVSNEGYLDYSSTQDENGALFSRVTDQANSGAFPVRLHYILNELEKDGTDDIMAWQVHGRSFVIAKPKALLEKILHNWFNMTKTSSFYRQLNVYGFRRITNGPDRNSYYHELFLRGKPFIAKSIVRLRKKGTYKQAVMPMTADPNLYAFPFLPPTKMPVGPSFAPSIASLAPVPTAVPSTGWVQSQNICIPTSFGQTQMSQPSHGVDPSSRLSSVAAVNNQYLLNLQHQQQQQSPPVILAIYIPPPNQQHQHVLQVPDSARSSSCVNGNDHLESNR